jgi:hypothetical protein
VSCDPEWDEEVDVVCTDSGIAGLATAISAADEDVDVFVASASDTPADGSRQSWFEFGDDAATAAYRDELTADLDVEALGHGDSNLPLRLSGELIPIRRRPRPPFEGPQLREWNARCVTAPTGYLYTRVTDWTSELMDCGGGDVVKVTEIGSMTPDLDNPAGSVTEWLTAEAQDRGVSPEPVRRFDRLVFEEGVVVGAVFSTDDGLLTIRARHGVLVCAKVTAARDDFYRELPGKPVLRVALVGKDASRFGRVELLTSDPEIAEMAPTPSRLRKADGYAAFGQ